MITPKEYRRKISEKRKLNGKCASCKNQALPNKSRCQSCRDKQNRNKRLKSFVNSPNPNRIWEEK